MKKIALTMTLAFAVVWLTGCILDKDKDKKEPGFNEFTISGELAGLRHDHAPPLDYWFLHIDTLYPGREDLYYCSANGYLGNIDTTDYTNPYMSPSFVVSTYAFSANSDTAIARNFTHWRLDITCPDSIPVPQ